MIEIVINTITFLIILGIFRSILLGYQINMTEIVILSGLYFIWSALMYVINS